MRAFPVEDVCLQIAKPPPPSTSGSTLPHPAPHDLESDANRANARTESARKCLHHFRWSGTPKNTPAVVAELLTTDCRRNFIPLGLQPGAVLADSHLESAWKSLHHFRWRPSPGPVTAPFAALRRSSAPGPLGQVTRLETSVAGAGSHLLDQRCISWRYGRLYISYS